MTSVLLLTDELRIPSEVRSFTEFRRWSLSDDFPERGRIDYLSGSIEVDMSPEEFFLHGTLKTELVAVLSTLVRSQGLGYVVSDRTRISCPNVELSVEPDVVYISKDSLSEGRVRLISPSGGGSDRFVEVEGPPDLIIEVVSNSSVSKDTQRLPVAYFQAGVGEYWLADARGKALVFTIYHRTEDAFRPVSPDRDGYQASSILNRRFRLTRQRDDQDHWVFDLEAK